MQKTSIDYLTHTCNPLAMRCTPVSEGCEHCWHLRMAHRLRWNPSMPYRSTMAYGGSAPVLIGKELEAPLHLRKPARIGVQFMGDLFHETITFQSISQVFETMEMAPRHTFLVLTKRPQRMLRFINRFYGEMLNLPPERITVTLENVWLGVSVENQARADERIPILLEIPAAKRWVSIEPLLGPIVLRRKAGDEREMVQMALMGRLEEYSRPVERGIDWVVLGGETGPGARPMHPDWARSVRDQCQAAGVPFYLKQMGEWVPTDAVPGGDLGGDMRRDIVRIVKASGENDGHFCKGDALMRRAKSGHLLDGREWRELPGVQG